ncbi:hypothetical protein CANINC_001516 [Pichia inconspicua]|uniref:Uncharacterized protein n=1 Tax=Pichia inconspicua TaxID=52247 RepID=A0A4T0X3G5_9ASCO|nr:hypothetical protein CANINC_001516 [[Candida] inconspicua]
MDREDNTRLRSTSMVGWKKLLWLKQPYEDNYTDTSFLSQLKRNSTVVKYSYTKLMDDFSIIVLHLSIIMFTIVVFYGIYILKWNPIKPTIWSTILTIIGFIIYVVTLKIRRNKELIELQQFKITQIYCTSPQTDTTLQSDLINLEEYLTEPPAPSIFETCKSSLLIILYLLTLSPVLKSLTNSTSSDSIWALSAWLCFLNVMFNDYQIDFKRVTPREKKLHWSKLFHNSYIGKSPIVTPITTRSSSPTPNRGTSNYTNVLDQPKLVDLDTGTKTNFFQIEHLQNSNFSKNIAVSNAIILASRLPTNASAFSFILFCIQTSGLFPIFNNFTRRAELRGFHQFQLITIVILVDALVWHIFGIGWVTLWIALHFMIIVVGPWYFLTLQKYKNELQGPWDPAQPIVKSL